MNEKVSLLKNSSEREINFLITSIKELLGVKFDNEQEKQKQIIEFIRQLKTEIPFKNLKPQEILLAYQFCINGKLQYKLFPTFSIIQLGEIIKLYLEFKITNEEHQIALQKIKNAFEKEMETKKIEDKSYQEDYYRLVFNEIKADIYSDKLHHKWDRFKNKINISVEDAKNLYEEEKIKYLKELNRKNAKMKKAVDSVMSLLETDSIEEVKIRCRNKLISKYLSKFKDFEDFKKEFN